MGRNGRYLLKGGEQIGHHIYIYTKTGGRRGAGEMIKWMRESGREYKGE